MKSTSRIVLRTLSLLVIVVAGCDPARATRRARLVVLISLDGATPDGIAQADAPHLDALIAAGSQSRNARTVYPCNTLPCHIAMLSGVTPKTHGISQNKFSDPLPKVTVPTVFDAVDQAGLYALMIVGKYKMLALRSGHYADLDEVGPLLRRETRHHVPDFVFIHSAEPDLAGHAEGWMSPAYLAALSRADHMVGQVVAWVREKGMWDQTLLIVSADHGGSGKTHRSENESDMVIPWIASGGVARGKHLPDRAMIHDIAPTVLAALGLPIPDGCEGHALTPLVEPVPLAVAQGVLAP